MMRAAMRFHPKKWLASLDLNKRIILLVGLLALATIVMTTVMIWWTTLRIVEGAIGDGLNHGDTETRRRQRRRAARHEMCTA